ncbi:MOP flippase family protein [Kineococcus indalonis]|uniref:MOP flippase family protein n=1 Tax=Kineococcus indalonis TaxID=2696566 RepID=UPI001411B56A|nr:MOP flippase family protein [Kineococcus indalonis]NAZ85192.1 MOP flippase family protein [Kineococcus indalonis]
MPAPGAAGPGGEVSTGPVVGADAQGSMTGKVVRGAGWSGAARMATQGLQFLVGLVLARLLLPEDFGLLASVYVITGFAVMFFEMGLGAALVHLPRPTERDMSTVFWVNALGGVVFAALVAAAAPLIADFYGQPQLRGIAPLVALSFTLAVGVVHNALLQRRLQFRTAATIEVSSALLGHATTLVAALLGAGALALAYGPLVASGSASVMSWCAVRWWPRHFVSADSFRRLWGFSSGMLGSNVVTYWGRNADNLLIGRFLGATPLGLYNRAYNLMLLPVTQLNGALQRVMFPALAAMQSDHARVRRAYLRAVGLVGALTIPFLVGIAAVADGLVPLLWGPNWEATVPLLQVLCIAGVPQCVGTTMGWIFQSQGRTRTMFLVQSASAGVGVVAMVVGLNWGITGVAWAVLVHAWVMGPVSLRIAGGVIGLGLPALLRQAWRSTAVAFLMGVLVWSLPLLLGVDRGSPWVLLVQVLAGVAVYVAGLRLVSPELFSEVGRLVGGRLRR